MSWTVYFALVGWVPFTLLLFGFLPGRRAAITALVFGYLFLPQAGVKLLGMDFTKASVMAVGLLLSVLLLDSSRLMQFRFRWHDVPMVVWCLTPLASSLTNDLGWNDGLSSVKGSLLQYGIFYFVGRLYLRCADDLMEFAMAILVGGVLYVPACLFEIRMSPQLHNMVYGFQQHSVAQAFRFGGWRPVVFLQHGLAVAIWMISATLIGLGLWRARRLAPVFHVAPSVTVPVLAVTAVLTKSAGAIVLMTLGAVALARSRVRRTTLPFLLLVFLTPVYLAARVFFDWRPDSVVEDVGEVSADRSGSLAVRIEADAHIVAHAMKRPWFGWGGWDRFRDGVVLTDTLWAITIGTTGLVGLTSLFSTLVIAQLAALRRLRRAGQEFWNHPEVVVLVLILTLYSLDCMMNAMPCPVFFALAGGLMGWGSEAGVPESSGESVFTGREA